MEIAVERDNFEVLVVLAGFAEVSADIKLDFLRMILENEGDKHYMEEFKKGDEQYVEEFKKNLEGLSVSEVSWRFADDQVLMFCPDLGEADESYSNVVASPLQ